MAVRALQGGRLPGWSRAIMQCVDVLTERVCVCVCAKIKSELCACISVPVCVSNQYHERAMPLEQPPLRLHVNAVAIAAICGVAPLASRWCFYHCALNHTGWAFIKHLGWKAPSPILFFKNISLPLFSGGFWSLLTPFLASITSVNQVITDCARTAPHSEA